MITPVIIGIIIIIGTSNLYQLFSHLPTQFSTVMRGYRLPTAALIAKGHVLADPYDPDFEQELEAAVPLDSWLRDFNDLCQAVDSHHTLFVHIERGNLDALKQMLTRDLELEPPQLNLLVYLDTGLTLLASAAREGHPEIVEYLLELDPGYGPAFHLNARQQDLTNQNGTACQPTALYLVSD